MVTYIGINENNPKKGIEMAFIQLAYCYNHNGRIAVFSDCLNDENYKDLIQRSEMTLHRLVSQPFQKFTCLDTSDIYKIQDVLDNMRYSFCKPDMCLIHLSEKAIKETAKTRSDFYYLIYDMIIDYFPDIDFILTVDETYISGCLKTL